MKDISNLKLPNYTLNVHRNSKVRQLQAYYKKGGKWYKVKQLKVINSKSKYTLNCEER